MTESRYVPVFFLAGLMGFASTAAAADDPPDLALPRLSSEAEKHIEELEGRLTELLDQRAYADALPLAREVAAVRSAGQGDEWWEAVDARQRVKLLEQVTHSPAEEQRAFAELMAESDRIVALYEQGKIQEGLEAAKDRTSALSDMLGPDGQEALRARIQVGRFLSMTGAYAAAEALHRKVLAARRRLLGEDHPEVGESLNDLGVQLYYQGKYEAAEQQYKEALAVRRRTRGSEHADVAQTLNNLAASYMSRGNYGPAEPLYMEALRIWRAAYGPEHPEVASALSNLGNLCRYQGDYRRAELLYRESLAIRRKAPGADAIGFGVTLNNLASMLQARGDYAAARPLYAESLEQLRPSLGSDHAYTASVLNNLATLLKDLESYEAAEPLYRNALAVRRGKLGPDHPRVAESLNNLARLLRLRGEYAEAEPLYREALAIWRKAYGDAHPHIAEGLNNLGALLTEMDRYDEAEPLLREGLQMRRALQGARHPSVVTSLFQLAKLNRRRQAYAEAEGFLREALSIALSERPRIASDEEGRAAFSGAIRLPEITAALADTLVRLHRPEDAFDVLEQGRSRAVLDLLARSDRDLLSEAEAKLGTAASAELERLLRSESDARDAVRRAEGRLASRRSKADAGADKVAADQTTVSAARRTLEEAEEAVLARLLDVWPEAQPAGTAAIRAQLAPGEALLTFSWTPMGVFVLFVPSRGTHTVRAELIADGRESVTALKDLATRARHETQVRGGSAPGAGSASHELWTRLIPPSLRSGVLSARRLIVIPDGPLRLFPLETLAVETRGEESGNRLLLDAGPPIVYADSGTVFVNRRKAVRKQPRAAEAGRWSAVIVADPTFGGAVATRDTEGAPPTDSAPIAWLSRSTEEQAAEVSALDQIRLYGGTLRPLPGTRNEARIITRIVERAGGQAEVLAGKAASLTGLEAHVVGTRFLHLATHGLAGSARRPLDASLALAQPAEPTPEDIGFLTLDHLIRTWRGKLKRCELAVLSACDTQVGIERGDSDLALPWGFMYAGAPAVLASLWKVDDQATRLLMQRFYENVLGQYDQPRNGHAAGIAMAKDEALHEAKMWLRRVSLPPSTALGVRGGLVAAPVFLSDGTGEPTFSDPYYWAGFVLLGAPD